MLAADGAAVQRMTGSWRGGAVPRRVALSVTAIAALVAPALAPAGRTVMAAALWGLTGAVALVLARARFERTAAWVIVGVVDLALLLTVLGDVAAGRADRVADWAIALTVGGYGVSLLVDGMLRRYRAGAIDAIVLLISFTTTWALLAPTADMASGVTGLATWDVVVVGAGFLGLAVSIAAAFSGFRKPQGTGAMPAVGLLLASVAAVLHVHGDPAGLSVVESLVWVGAGGATTLGLLQPVPTQVPQRTAGGTSLSRVAVLLLYVLSVAPVFVATLIGADGSSRTAALVVALLCALLLSLRVMRTSTTLVEGAETAARVRFEELVRHAAEVQALVDDEGRVFYVTQSVERTLGMPPEDVAGLEVASLVVPDDRHLLAAAFAAAAMSPGRPVPLELRVLGVDGAERHAEGTVVDLRQVDGVEARSLTLRDVSGRKELEYQLVRRARVDDLTELARRSVIEERVHEVVRRSGSGCALLHLDVNDLTLVNDAYGHGAGDAVLREVAIRVGSVLRDGDTAARIGGDEFAVLLERIGDDGATAVQRVCDRIHEAMEPPVELPVDGELAVRVTVGAALGGEELGAEELVAAATTAVLVARQAKRPTVFYERGMNLAARHRLRMMADLERALEEHRITMFYQPILPATGDGTVAQAPAVEALLRWRHPEDGPVRPDETVEHAVRAGLAAVLTRECIDRVAADVAAFNVATGQRLHVSINLAAEQLAEFDVVDALHRLAMGGIQPEEVTFEVTETSMFDDVDHAVGILDRLRAEGCTVAVDDFGTGYASLGYLRQLPLDKLKIDKRFVDEVLDKGDPQDSFVAVIQGLAEHLDLVTVAEGVETREQLEALRDLGCDLIQGYHLGRPSSMRDLITRTVDEQGVAGGFASLQDAADWTSPAG